MISWVSLLCRTARSLVFYLSLHRVAFILPCGAYYQCIMSNRIESHRTACTSWHIIHPWKGYSVITANPASISIFIRHLIQSPELIWDVLWHDFCMVLISKPTLMFATILHYGSGRNKYYLVHLSFDQKCSRKLQTYLCC